MVIVVDGIYIGSVLESEGNDRANINLPGQQLKLLQDAASSAKGRQTNLMICQS